MANKLNSKLFYDLIASISDHKGRPEARLMAPDGFADIRDRDPIYIELLADSSHDAEIAKPNATGAEVSHQVV
jgi:hypothetical protein